jgi:hypothetical protein
LCWITASTDGTFGAQAPGLFWPTMVMQDSSDGSWIAGPYINIAGISLGGGTGTNGDSRDEGFGFAGQTSSGGKLALWDDSSAERDRDTWTVEFQPYAGELSEATIYACPMGHPTVWPAVSSEGGSGVPAMAPQ